jgi:uncharacterized protein (TIGR03118 family)
MRLPHFSRWLCCTALLLSPLLAQNHKHYAQTNLVSDVPGMATHTDANLVNAWGIASSSTGPWWVNANGTGFALVYNGAGDPYPTGMGLVVAIPSTTGTGNAPPTGIVFNDTPDFQINGAPAFFLFSAEDGGISGWNTGTTAVLKITTPGANYKSLTLGSFNGKNVLYAANFAAATVDTFDGTFSPIALPSGAFQDPMVPAGYSPFSVQNIGGTIFVVFAQVGEGGDENHGPGLGYVDQFGPDGKLIRRLEHGPWMNAPWGIARAPGGFGSLSNHILVGQFGSGQIAAFHESNGKFAGLMEDDSGVPITIDGLWGIRFGNGGNAGSPQQLFFAAGPQDESHGLFGVVTFKGQD